MAKVHTRKKRLLGLITTARHKSFFSGKAKSSRPKTFRTKEQAEEYAKVNKVEKFEIIPAKKGKRFQIK